MTEFSPMDRPEMLGEPMPKWGPSAEAIARATRVAEQTAERYGVPVEQRFTYQEKEEKDGH